MPQRINIQHLQPEAYKALYHLEKYLASSDLSVSHKNLIKIRASQVNGCGFCINLHTKEARAANESEQRIYLLDVWKEVSLFSESEKALLALTESVTKIPEHVSDDVYGAAATVFGEVYLAQIIMAIVAINCWNRIAITTQLQPDQP